MVCREIFFSDHTVIQMFKRNITVDNVKFVITIGEMIATYPNDKPYPSFLILGYVNGRPVHVVVGQDYLEKCIVITTYEPDKDIWQIGFKLKRE